MDPVAPTLPPTPPPDQRAFLFTTRKGLLTMMVLIMVTALAIGLSVAAVLGRVPWERALTLMTTALGIFGGTAIANQLGIAHEDGARLKANALPSVKIDASSSATQVGGSAVDDPDATLDPDRPATDAGKPS